MPIVESGVVAAAKRASADQGAVPAIVVARGATGLGTLRCLAMAGIPAYVACPADDLVARSRWYRALPGSCGWDGSIGAETGDLLDALPLERAVLIPGRDDAALWLAELPAPLGNDRFQVSSSSRETLAILQDKSRFGHFLKHTDMPHPRTFAVQVAADIDAIPFEELDRVFLKPVDSQRFSEAVGAKGIWAKGRREFEEVWQTLNTRGFEVIAQEYVPGRASDHYFVDGFRDRSGELAALFARRRIRIYPADFGNSSFCQSVPLSELGPAVGQLDALLAALNYRGIFSAEFKRDARCGTLRLLEINTRAWWYVEFAARCGVNVCEMAYEDAQAMPVSHRMPAYPAGRGCMNLENDIKAVLAPGTRRAEPLGRTLVSWVHAYCHVFRWDDPWPALSILAARLWQRILPGNKQDRAPRPTVVQAPSPPVPVSGPRPP